LLVSQLVYWSVSWSVGQCGGVLVYVSVGVSVGLLVGLSWLVEFWAHVMFPPNFHRYCTPRIGLHWVMSSQLQSRGPVWALTQIVTLSHACALHKGMLWGVQLGMLWGTLKSTFCHRSSPNRSYSKNEVYPRIKHDA
jgi:hypothetical protein